MEYKILIKSNNKYYSWDSLGGWLEINEPQSDQDYIDYGFSKDDLPNISENEWDILPDKTVIYFTDDPEVEELTIETETDPFTIYDEMGESMEVLYYTDDPDKESAGLDVTANYSPLDELDDFEVVTWTDDSEANLKLNMNAVPTPKFIYKTNPMNVYGYLEKIDFALSTEELDGDKYRILFSLDKERWKVWDSTGKSFVNIDLANANLLNDGMTIEEVKSLEENDWSVWNDQSFYLGIFINEKLEETDGRITSIETIELAPTETTKVSDAKMYILNTKSTIDLTLQGSTLSGTLDDEDLTKVQYRVVLNGEPYYPSDGEFTNLSEPPLNIGIRLDSKDYIMDEENILRVEFQDYWGSTDYWEKTFIGQLNGLLFFDETGDYYSTEVGEVLKYLDFGVITAGQTTVEHKIKLKNTYGYPVKNVNVKVDQSNFPNAMSVEFSTSGTTFIPSEFITYDTMKDGEEREFYIRLVTDLGETPSATGSFDIEVTADKDNELD